MTILVDAPRWPAHDRLWSHLVSDSCLAELHAFAHSIELPARSFDVDHYDLPAERLADAVAAGAQLVSATELMRRLTASGLRVPARERPGGALRVVRERWRAVMPGHDRLGAELLARWSESHRVYHSTPHLLDVLCHLDDLWADLALRTALTGGTRARMAGGPGGGTRQVAAHRQALVLAAWFHDAVHTGGLESGPESSADEELSALLAEELLPRAGVSPSSVAEVARLVRLTASHEIEPGDPLGAVLSDADLGILGAPPARYARYRVAIRHEYAHVPAADFRVGRARVMEDLLGRPRLFHTRHGREHWESQARANLAQELAQLLG